MLFFQSPPKGGKERDFAPGITALVSVAKGVRVFTKSGKFSAAVCPSSTGSTLWFRIGSCGGLCATLPLPHVPRSTCPTDPAALPRPRG